MPECNGSNTPGYYLVCDLDDGVIVFFVPDDPTKWIRPVGKTLGTGQLEAALSIVLNNSGVRYEVQKGNEALGKMVEAMRERQTPAVNGVAADGHDPRGVLYVTDRFLPWNLSATADCLMHRLSADEALGRIGYQDTSLCISAQSVADALREQTTQPTLKVAVPTSDRQWTMMPGDECMVLSLNQGVIQVLYIRAVPATRSPVDAAVAKGKDDDASVF